MLVTRRTSPYGHTMRCHDDIYLVIIQGNLIPMPLYNSMMPPGPNARGLRDVQQQPSLYYVAYEFLRRIPYDRKDPSTDVITTTRINKGY